MSAPGGSVRLDNIVGVVWSGVGFSRAANVNPGIILWIILGNLGEAAIDFSFQGPDLVDLGIVPPNSHGWAI